MPTAADGLWISSRPPPWTDLHSRPINYSQFFNGVRVSCRSADKDRSRVGARERSGAVGYNLGLTSGKLGLWSSSFPLIVPI